MIAGEGVGGKEGLHAWNLGLADKQQGKHEEAVRYMQVVAYEQEIGHPDAEADGQRVREVLRR